MRFHSEVLEPLQDEVLASAAAGIASLGFRLGGGTALALVFGHLLARRASPAREAIGQRIPMDHPSYFVGPSP